MALLQKIQHGPALVVEFRWVSWSSGNWEKTPSFYNRSNGKTASGDVLISMVMKKELGRQHVLPAQCEILPELPKGNFAQNLAECNRDSCCFGGPRKYGRETLM